MLPRIIKLILVIAAFMVAAATSTYLTVHLLIRSEDTVVVPDLSGKEAVYALELLSDLGLNTKVKASQYSNVVPRHHIISQDPDPGHTLKKGRDVRLIISKGASTVVIPNLVGIDMPRVRIYLDENRLRQGTLSYVFTHEPAQDEVLAQYPPPGSMAVRAEAVDLLISAGAAPQLSAMADFAGMDLGQAIEAIEERHLMLGAIETVYLPGQKNDMVVNHRPESGYPVLSGGNVDLTVNRTQRRAEAGPRPAVQLYRYPVERGFLNSHIRIKINRAVTSMDLFDAFIKPGREIWLLIPRDQPATVVVYADDEVVETRHFD